MSDKMDICFLCNGHAYTINLGVTIVSLLINSDKDDNFCFHIITSDMSEDDREKLIQLKEIKDFDIKFYDVDENIVNKYEKLIKDSKMPNWYGYTILLKLEIPNLLKDLDKVLFLDIDILILKSLKEIFNENIDEYYLLTSYGMTDLLDYFRSEDCEIFFEGCNVSNKEEFYKLAYKNSQKAFKEAEITDKKPEEWISAGFMYLNLIKLREIYDEQKIINYISFLIDKGLVPYEEYVINHFIKNNYVKRISPKYHTISAIWLENKYIDDIYMAHCSAGKIFHLGENNIPRCKNKILLLGWKYLTMTPWFKEDSIYFLEHYSRYNTHHTKKRINKLIDKIVWLIPIRKIRINLRKKLQNDFYIASNNYL